jgi:zinc transport system permease protein
MGEFMSDFFAILSFSIIPLLLVSAFSLLTPAMGAVLALRNEIMLALALPSVANAGMALALLCGINPEQRLFLYLFATAATLLAIFLTMAFKISTRTRELRLAGLFVSGQVLSLVFGSISTNAHVHVVHLLNGEVLAAGTIETSLICAGFVGLIAATFSAKRLLYCWCADEDFFRTEIKRYRLFMVVIYSIVAAVITIGVATIGTLLVTALLVLPALLGDRGKGGISRYVVMVTIIGMSGSVIGFLSSLVFDLPPAVCAAAGVGVVGILVHVRLNVGKSKFL